MINDHPGDMYWRKREIECIKQFLPLLKQPILDLGCGEGQVGNLLFKKGELVGCDINKHFLDINNYEAYAEKVLVWGDNLKDKILPFNNEQFPSVFCNSVIEHVEDYFAMVKEIRRVLKPGGLVLLTIPTDTLIIYLSKLRGRIYSYLRNKQLQHYNLFNIDKWKWILSVYDIKVIDYKYYLTLGDIMCWDKMCFNLKFSKPIPKLYNKLKAKYFIEANWDYPYIDLKEGAGLLIIGEKI